MDVQRQDKIYPILLHHCCNIIVDDFYMINK